MVEQTNEMSVLEAKEIVVKEIKRRQKRNESMKKWRVENRDKYAEYMKTWYAARKEKVAAALAILEANKSK